MEQMGASSLTFDCSLSPLMHTQSLSTDMLKVYVQGKFQPSQVSKHLFPSWNISFSIAMIPLSFKKQNAYGRGRKIWKLWIIQQSLWQLVSLARLWLYLNFCYFFTLFPQQIKRTTNTSSADSVKLVKSDKLASSEIYRTPYPKC